MVYNCYKLHKEIDTQLNSAGIKCDFHIQKQAAIKADIVAITSLFKMRQSYRSFTSYLNQLTESCEVNRRHPLIIRIYYDKSTEREVATFAKYSNVELIRYKFYDVADGPNNHQGTFGTLMRMMSIFKFANNSKVCCGFDADMLLDYNEIVKCIGVMHKYNAPYYGIYYDTLTIELAASRVGNVVINDTNQDPKNGDYIMASYICEPDKLDLRFSIFTNFLSSAISGAPEFKAWTTAVDKIRHNIKLNTVFRYGIDEYFMNTQIAPVVHKQHNIIGTRLYSNLRKLHYELYKSVNSHKIDDSHVSEVIKVLSDLYESFGPKSASREKTSTNDYARLVDLVNKIDKDFFKYIDIFKSLNKGLFTCKRYLDILIDMYSKGILALSGEMEEFAIFHRDTIYVDDIYILHKALEQQIGAGNKSNPPLNGASRDKNKTHQIGASRDKSNSPRGASHSKCLVLVPYGDLRSEEKRREQLLQFIAHIYKLIDQSASHDQYTVLIAEQVEPKNKFGKGQLYNAAVKWYVDTLGMPSRIILHDVDLLPDRELFEQYTITTLPSQMVPQNERFAKLYDSKFSIPIGGGITAITPEQYIRANGFPNNFWGWGGEDNAFQLRLKYNKIPRHYNMIGDFTSIDNQRTTDATKLEYVNSAQLRNSKASAMIKQDTHNWQDNGYSQMSNLTYSATPVGIANDLLTKVDNPTLATGSLLHLQVRLDTHHQGGVGVATRISHGKNTGTASRFKNTMNVTAAQQITAIDLLNAYKRKIIDLATSTNEQRFISDSFTRWYLNSDRDRRFIPTKDVVDVADLKFANLHRQCRFNVTQFKTEAERLYSDMMNRATSIVSDIYPNQDNLLSAPQLTRLKDLYKGQAFESDKNKLIAIYNFIGMNSAHLSIPPMFGGIELFGSPLNTHNPFCSPFDLEKEFGSLGSFFDFDIANSDETFFTANPPFDEAIMEEMARYLDSQLAAANTSKTIVITIPVWDSASQKALGVRDFGMDFKAFELLKKSKYMKEHEIFDRGTYPYWDYYKQQLSPVSYTHLIILANKSPSVTLKEVKQKWQSFISAHNAGHTRQGGTRPDIYIIVPFADFNPEQRRKDQLVQFIKHMSPLLARQSEKVSVVIAEQISPLKYFNRGQLLNAGVKWATDNLGQSRYIILHDVDMLPDEALFAEYIAAKDPTSLVPQDAEYRQKYGRVNLSAGGGIFGLPYSTFKECNGYPNRFWAWGGEDDAFGKRLMAANHHSFKFKRVRKGHIFHIDVQRQSHHTKMDYLRKNQIRSMMVHENLSRDGGEWKSDGYTQVAAIPICKSSASNVCQIAEHIYHVQYKLTEDGLADFIAHNERVYKELGGGKSL